MDRIGSDRIGCPEEVKVRCRIGARARTHRTHGSASRFTLKPEGPDRTGSDRIETERNGTNRDGNRNGSDRPAVAGRRDRGTYGFSGYDFVNFSQNNIRRVHAPYRTLMFV